MNNLPKVNPRAREMNLHLNTENAPDTLIRLYKKANGHSQINT